MRSAAAVCVAALAIAASSSQAQDTDDIVFANGKGDAKIHAASGFVCPLAIGHFERDAVGEADPDTHADFCAYSARDGVYGTITLKPLTGPYDAKASLFAQFAEQEGSAGRFIGEGMLKIPVGHGKAPLPIYMRSYETAALSDQHYRVLFAGGAIGSWAVEATVEYAEPRDNDEERHFLAAVYASALGEIPSAPPAQARAAPPLAPPSGAR